MPPDPNDVLENCCPEDQAVDIQTLIEESRTDSELEGSSPELTLKDDQEDLETIKAICIDPDAADDFHRKMKNKSSELLRPSSRYKSKHFSKPERKRAIKFDTVALFLDAASEGDLEEVKRLIVEEHVDMGICNEKGVTALHRAAAYGQVEVIDFLIANKAKVNVCDASNWTPLHHAVSSGSLDAVKMLLMHGANVEAMTDSKEVPSDLTEIPEILRHLTLIKASKYNSNLVTALYDFSKSSFPESTGDELSLAEGDTIKIRNRDDPDWWLAEKEGQEGYVPRSLVQ